MTSEQDILYHIALRQSETSRKFGRQARQECSEEEAVAVLTDYVRVVDELEQTKDAWFEGQADVVTLKADIQSLHGKVGAAQRKLNEQERLIEQQLDTIHELTAQLDERDIQ